MNWAILIILGLLTLSGCVQMSSSGTLGGGKPDISATIDITVKEKEQLVTDLGAVYAGMPKEDLARVGFGQYLRKGYYQKGREEWITFSDWTTEEKDDLITFYLLDGKVKDWEQNTEL